MRKLLRLVLVLMALLVVPAAAGSLAGCNFDDDDGESELDM